MRNREALYRLMHSCANRNGVIQRTQLEMAELCEMSYQQLSKVMTEFQNLGLISKDKHKFTVLYNPEDIPWGEKFDALRDRYIQRIGNINATKSERISRENLLDIH